LASPVKPTLNGSILIGLTGVTKLCLSSVSFRRSTGVYKSDSIGSTGERNTDLTCKSTGDISVQPAYTKVISSDQPAFRCRSCGVSGKLHPTQSTGVQTLCVGSTGVKENRGSHLSYMCLVRAVGFSFLLCFARLLPSHAAAAPHPPPRRHHSPSLAHAHAAARLHAEPPRHTPYSPPAQGAAAQPAPPPARALTPPALLERRRPSASVLPPLLLHAVAAF